ncbi:virulence-associated E family protein [Bradyrhizobium sp. NBAIM01]|uniref:virulence-associated E family protein n=1 Tax=Bradyrhizobium sp. NBAIM01 TaxID=2793818 RepID=UPI001CD65D62|nr:virulence-associated E family protein [Bradyrhizobium sp. NBAIM01]MCA1513642.1 hypothetical protein [Bradyrhizobium sp. NBAIM01]
MTELASTVARDWRAELAEIEDWDEWMSAASDLVRSGHASQAEIIDEYELGVDDTKALSATLAASPTLDLVALVTAHRLKAPDLNSAGAGLTEEERAYGEPEAEEIEAEVETEEEGAPSIIAPPPVPAPASASPPSTVWVDPDAAAEIDWRAGGRTLQNAKVAIAKLGIRCQFDDFHKKYMVHGHPCMKGGSVSESLDNMALMVRNEISKVFKLDIAKGLVMEALQIKCMERAFDPVRDYLDGLQWDGRARLDRWLVTYCGAEDTEYVRAVGRKVLVAAVRRAREPGCKFDYLMVMEGPQGAGKSTALRILAGGENFSDAQVLRLRDKEQQEAIGGIWIYEIAELAGRHIDVEGLKAFLSKTVDAARAAYGHGRTDQRRRCVFVATTNNDQYLKDGTGNRRFWPVRVAEIDLEGLQFDRDQLWAEAAAAEVTGEPLVIPAALWNVAAEETAVRMEHDPWADIIGDKLAQLEAAALGGRMLTTKLFARGEDAQGPHWRVASDYLLTEVLSIPKARQANWQTKRLANVMRSLGWTWCENPLRFGTAGQKRGFMKLIEDSE